MAAVLRSDFAQASVGLTLPAQKKHLAQLHDWLVNEQRIGDQERVIACTNYQQGRFGRMPTHILLVTTARIAFTHDGGMRSIPIADLDTTRIGLNAGIINGELTLVLRTGETMTFRRGMSVGMQEVATALTTTAIRPALTPPETSPVTPPPVYTPPPSAPATQPRQPTPTAPAPAPAPAPGRIDYTRRGRGPVHPDTTPSPGRIDYTKRPDRRAGHHPDVPTPTAPVSPAPVPEPAPAPPPQVPPLEERTQRGHGDGVVQFAEPVAVPMPVSISGGPAGLGVFSVWALGENFERVDLLVNVSEDYTGVTVIGHQQPIRALQVETTGPWAITPLVPDELPVLADGCTGHGDTVVMLNADLSPCTEGMLVAVTIHAGPQMGLAGLWAHGSHPDLLVNDTAPYSGIQVIPPGTQYLVLTAPGDWSLARQ